MAGDPEQAAATRNTAAARNEALMPLPEVTSLPAPV
jgi:hypothetical protein